LSIYADSSVLVALYLADRRLVQAQRLRGRYGRAWLTPLHRAELAQAVAQQLYMKRVSAAQAQEVLANFQRDRQSAVWMEVSHPESAFDRSIQLVEQYGGRVPLATLDTLHVASALELGSERFLTFDERQAKLARAVGLKVS